MTVLAWGMSEFKSAYINSNDWEASLDLLKWGTDYLLKAHTAKYELYVQVKNESAFDKFLLQVLLTRLWQC